MSAPHDTAEDVEASASGWELVSPETAAMLRRLHAAKVEAERERDQWIANSRENKMIAESNLRERDEARAALTTARANALRDAISLALDTKIVPGVCPITVLVGRLEALIEKEPK